SNDFQLSDHLRTVLAVPPSMRLMALLQRMQATRRHMALVIDEYGGVDGLVTIEDVIEQIVGQIEDEHDDAEGPLWVKQADGAYLAEARAFVDEFQEATGLALLIEDWEEDVDTLGGVVFMLSGRVPERGEVIPHPSGFEFEIVDADPRRIKRLRIRERDQRRKPARREEIAKVDAAKAEPEKPGVNGVINGAAHASDTPSIKVDG
nr:CBS domain-containing protein [Paracoccaceae bacterium]